MLPRAEGMGAVQPHLLIEQGVYQHQRKHHNQHGRESFLVYVAYEQCAAEGADSCGQDGGDKLAPDKRHFFEVVKC